MKNFKIGSRVYHFMNMAKVGTIVDIESTPIRVMTTGGSLSSLTVMTVRYSDGTEEKHKPGDLMRED